MAKSVCADLVAPTPVAGRLQADHIDRNPSPIVKKNKRLALPSARVTSASVACAHRGWITWSLAWERTATLVLQRTGDQRAKSVSVVFGRTFGEMNVLLIERGHTTYGRGALPPGFFRAEIYRADHSWAGR